MAADFCGTMGEMLAVIACLLGLSAIVLAGEVVRRRKILKGEHQRKFVHIAAGTFMAFWPWLISWQAVQIIGLVLLAATTYNHYVYKSLYYNGGPHRGSYGDMLLALAVVLCALLTDDKLFFTLALLQVALADGLAAVIGTDYGKKWRYKVFGYQKTVIGTMMFWFTSLFILGIGLLAVNSAVPFSGYYYLLLLLPPALTLLENAAIMGLDNIVVPVVAILALRLAS